VTTRRNCYDNDPNCYGINLGSNPSGYVSPIQRLLIILNFVDVTFKQIIVIVMSRKCKPDD
jgi:hypothetical protein